VHRVNRKTNLLPESSVILHTFTRDFWGLQTHDNVQPPYCAAGSRLLRGKFIRSPATCPL
jgi:hypothetical protein